MIEVLSWIVFGLIAGVVAKAFMPGEDPGGAIVTILLGIAGAVVGGYLSRLLSINGGSFIGFVMAVIGAIILLGLYRLIKGSSATAF